MYTYYNSKCDSNDNNIIIINTKPNLKYYYKIIKKESARDKNIISVFQ
jgi:hypothetical protein